MAETYPTWSEREDEILRTTYPEFGIQGTIEALGREGFVRTVGAVKMHAKILGVRADPTKRHRKERPKPERRYDSRVRRTVLNICLNDRDDEDVIRILRAKSNRSEYVRDLVRRDNGKEKSLV